MRNFIYLLTMIVLIYIHTHWSFFSCMSSPTLLLKSFDNTHSKGCVVMSHYSYNLCFPLINKADLFAFFVGNLLFFIWEIPPRVFFYDNKLIRHIPSYWSVLYIFCLLKIILFSTSPRVVSCLCSLYCLFCFKRLQYHPISFNPW